MNDRYLFRGRRLDNEEWIVGWVKFRLHDGDLTQSEYSTFIQTKDYMEKIGKIYNTTFEVNPITVGQCTGLKDKNGELIFEGDKVECCMIGLRAIVKNEIGTVQYADGCFEVLFNDGLRQYLKCFIANYAAKVIRTKKGTFAP